MVDANQVWEVDQAIEWIKALSQFDLWWVEEPVHPDDILGHRKIIDAVGPIRIATGEHCHNRLIFKQFLMAKAIDVVQADGCRLAGLSGRWPCCCWQRSTTARCARTPAASPVRDRAAISMIDYLCFSATWDERMTEHAAHLHEHFVAPIRIENGRYVVPRAAGLNLQMYEKSIADYEFPNGSAWAR
jgi:L-fuconate dehydratase